MSASLQSQTIDVSELDESPSLPRRTWLYVLVGLAGLVTVLPCLSIL